MDAQQAAVLEQLAAGLDGLDYFQVLQVATGAGPTDIKRAFYRESRTYHPDRFFHLADPATKAWVNTIYKRITEAYFVLRDDAKRRKYLADLGGPERAAKLRFTEAQESEQKAEAKKAVEEEYGTVPKARQFFKTALADIDAGRWEAAERNLKMGLTYEPSATRFKERLAEVQKKLDELRKAAGDQFKIR